MDEMKCQECGGEGDQLETLRNDGGDTKDQWWVYCAECDIETFGDIPDEDQSE